MAKMTRTQQRRMVTSIESKAWKLVGQDVLTVKDYEQIIKPLKRAFNKLK